MVFSTDILAVVVSAISVVCELNFLFFSSFFRASFFLVASPNNLVEKFPMFFPFQTNLILSPKNRRLIGDRKTTSSENLSVFSLDSSTFTFPFYIVGCIRCLHVLNSTHVLMLLENHVQCLRLCFCKFPFILIQAELRLGFGHQILFFFCLWIIEAFNSGLLMVSRQSCLQQNENHKKTKRLETNDSKD